VSLSHAEMRYLIEMLSADISRIRSFTESIMEKLFSIAQYTGFHLVAIYILILKIFLSRTYKENISDNPKTWIGTDYERYAYVFMLFVD